MRKHLLSLVSASLLSIGMLAVSAHLAPAQAQNKNAMALMAADTAWSNAAVARNIDVLASFYAEDGIAYPPNEPAAVGRAAAKKVWAGYFANPTFQISWKATSAGAEQRTGWTVGTYQASFKGPDGKSVAEKGKYVTVWRKDTDGKWRAIHDIWSSDAK